jgi:hypothetical protein
LDRAGHETAQPNFTCHCRCRMASLPRSWLRDQIEAARKRVVWRS